MAGRLLLDTSLIIDAFGGDLAAWRTIRHSGGVRVPAITVGELL